LPDVLPSRLSEIAKAIHAVNSIHNEYPNAHPWVLWNFTKKQKIRRNPFDGKLQIIMNVLGMAKYVKPQQGKMKPFKPSSVDSLDLLEAIFMKKEFPLKALIPEFSAKLSYDFLGSFSNEKQEPVFLIRDNIAYMIHLLRFLDKLEVIKMGDNINLVGKYLEGCKGLEPLNKFLSEEAVGLDNAEKQCAFLGGLLFGKLIAFQQARRVSNNALKWLKGLEIGPQDLMDIFIKTRSKIDDYSFPRHSWSEEMKGVAEAIGALGSRIGSNWTISRREVPYYFCLGQSLSGYYLRGKGDDSKSEDK
jgi:CRISPR-associated protein Cas8b/Csh1 subtype I-B